MSHASDPRGFIKLGKSLIEQKEYAEACKALAEQDLVNSPSHYTQYKGLEVIDLTEQMNFNKGNAVKYICRAGFKDPEKHVEDLEKAVWYLTREIERIKKNASGA